MPEFEAPGVFVEEVSFRAKAIDGVPTSTLGMTGRTLTGPSEPILLTSWTEYEATFGAPGTADGEPLYLAHAARAFFDNGGQRLWVTSAGTDVPPDAEALKAGLAQLADVDDIAMVACPDTVTLPADEQVEAVQNLIDHCESLRYRFAIVDAPADSTLTDVQSFRSHFDSTHGALYYPWVVTPDPPPLALPPSGFVAGLLARTDLERGVHTAPTSEPVHGITGLSLDITQAQQEQLNPHGINTLRTFAGRGIRLWGIRTLSADPEWQYVQVRRLFLYLEHSIDKGTQWAVFEPNNEQLWASVRQVIENFLFTTWQSGALLGSKPEEAFFVKCDRTTMTQNDLDNGRLVCLVGVAPIKPAEFVIFRIGQRTADAT